MSLVNASALDTSPPEWLVGDNKGSGAGMIPAAGTGFAWGPRTAGKSLVFGIDLGLAIANGVDFLGQPTVKSKVVYCVGEGLYDLGMRKQARLARQARDNDLAVAAIAREQGPEAAAAFAASLPAYDDSNLFILTEPFTVPLLSSREQTASLKQAITTIKRLNTPGPDEDPETFEYIGLVQLDSLADFTGRSLSNDASANLISSGMKTLARELECFVLAIAHPTAKGDQMLGAGRLLNAADTEIEVRPDDVSAPGAPQTASVICHKSKYGAPFETVGYRIEPCEWDEPELDDDDQPTGGTVRASSATVRLIEEDVKADTAARKPAYVAAPLPELRDPTGGRPRKRTGLKPQRTGLTLAADQPKPAGQLALAELQRDITRLVLVPKCSVCSRPGQVGCDARMTPRPQLIGRGASSGALYVHDERILDAAMAQPDPDSFLAEVGALTAIPA